MAQLYTKVKKYLEANSKTWDAEKSNILLQNDTGTDYIKSWNVSGLAEPTAEQLASYETAGNTAEALQVVLNKRRKEYPSWQDQMDMQYKDLVNSSTTWKDAIAKVKSDNPK
jgi:hypothetical protein|tara:strand:+ start:561 stop:896 length:336 start_codon:yes stop_codon:yes gene_type:complete